jgi:enediyne biosynthesis protein E4
MVRRLWLALVIVPLFNAACGRHDEAVVVPAPAKPAKETGKPLGPPLFEDITAASGVSFTYRNGEDTANHLSILESLGGGAALIDFNGDGLYDIFLPGGGFFLNDQSTYWQR